MKSPKSFKMVMGLAMTIICALYTIFGLLGYLKYGENYKRNVILNIGSTEML